MCGYNKFYKKNVWQSGIHHKIIFLAYQVKKKKVSQKKKKSLVKKLYIEKKKIETTFSLDIKKWCKGYYKFNNVIVYRISQLVNVANCD